MPLLRDQQLDLVAALYSGEDHGATDHLRADGGAAALALAIYRNNLREGFRKALALSFPVTLRLVGDDFFGSLAARYQDVHPSSRGDLQHAGERFADWLDEEFADTAHRYLGPVAALEWAVQQVCIAADEAPLDPLHVAAVPAEAYGALRFRPLPASRLVVTPMPAMAIWAANQPGCDGACEVDFSAGPESVLVARGPEGVVLTRLPPPVAALLGDLAGGALLGDACEAFLQRWPGADFAAALRTLCLLPAFASAGIEPESIRT